MLKLYFGSRFTLPKYHPYIVSHYAKIILAEYLMVISGKEKHMNK